MNDNSVFMHLIHGWILVAGIAMCLTGGARGDTLTFPGSPPIEVPQGTQADFHNPNDRTVVGYRCHQDTPATQAGHFRLLTDGTNFLFIIQGTCFET